MSDKKYLISEVGGKDCGLREMTKIADIPEAICPFCGGYGRGYCSLSQIYYICDSCDYQGPKVYTRSIVSIGPRIKAKNMFENKGELK